MWWSRLLLLMLLLLPFSVAQAGEKEDQQEALLQTVRGFYSWVLDNAADVQRLEPRVVQVHGSSRLTLDLTTLERYCDAFMRSGYFAPEFPAHLEAFYRRSLQQLGKYPQEEFDEMARHGRGPLIDSEDIDVFFCSQEPEYTVSYVAGTRLTILKRDPATATAEVVTPDQWKTTFSFSKVGGRWLISGYCLYQ